MNIIMNALDTRLKIMNIDTAEMTEEQKWTAGTGLTFIPEDTDENGDWYVPGGAGNVLSEDEVQDTTEDEEQGDGDTEGEDTPEQVDPQPEDDVIPEEKLEEDEDDEPKDTEETKENEGPASDITVETQE